MKEWRVPLSGWKTLVKNNTKIKMDNRQINLDGPAGTRDFLPEDMVLREWLFNIWKKISIK